MTDRRYFLAQDQSTHWYLVPAERRQDWDAWCNLDEDDAASWERPDWASRLDGDPSRVTFAEPRDDKAEAEAAAMATTGWVRDVRASVFQLSSSTWRDHITCEAFV